MVLDELKDRELVELPTMEEAEATCVDEVAAPRAVLEDPANVLEKGKTEVVLAIGGGRDVVCSSVHVVSAPATDVAVELL